MFITALLLVVFFYLGNFTYGIDSCYFKVFLIDD